MVEARCRPNPLPFRATAGHIEHVFAAVLVLPMWRDNSCITSRACCVIVYALSTGRRTCAGGWACTTGIACRVMVHAASTSRSTWAGGGVGMHYKLKG